MEARKKKEKVIVIDGDDVIWDFTGTTTLLTNLTYGTCITPEQVNVWDYNGLELIDALGNRVTGEMLLNVYKTYENHGLYSVLSLKPFAKFAIELMKKSGYLVYILTARDEKFRKETELQIMLGGLSIDKIIFNWDKVIELNRLSKTYKVVCMVDDKSSTCTAISEKCKVGKVFLMNAPTNKDFDESDTDIIRVNDLLDVVKNIGKVAK